ncbi:MAG: DNA-processing protein DprA [bacterium]|nr:DNA-processing protein DprA [bacterium]
MDDNLQYYLGFSYFMGIGPIKFDLLMRVFGDAASAYNASPQDLTTYLGVSLANKFVVFRNSFNPQKEIESIIKSGITVLTREHPQYPPQLMNLYDPPICLYVKGDISSYNWEKDLLIAIVGTRKPSDYGRQITTKFSRELAQAGCVIVSGMALGVDGIAHWAALNEGKRTIAVLGSGINYISPPTHEELYYKIIASGGLVMSEFPSHMQTIKGMFVSRNRIVSGLSRGVIVTEGLKNSGSLITARLALEQGKDVFAPPVPITSSQSEAPTRLLKNGAKLITSGADVLEEYGMENNQAVERVMSQLGEKERALAELLAKEAFTPDELARLVKAPIHQILTLLSTMELSGIVEKNNQGKYQIRV